MVAPRDEVVRAITDDLVRAVLDDLLPAVVAYRREMGRRLGLDATEWLCLDLLRRVGPLRSATLADRAGVTSSAISKALRRLEADGHVRRRAGAGGGGQEVVAELADHTARDALLDEQQRLLWHEVVHLVRRCGLDDPDRLAVLTTWNAMITHTPHGRARELGDAATSARRNAANGGHRWEREIGW